MIERQGLIAGDDLDPVDLQARQAARLRAGGKHDVTALVEVITDGHLGGRDQTAFAVYDLDLAAREQSLQTLEQPVDNLVFVDVHGWHVDPVEAGDNAEVARVPGQISDLGGVQQRLGRYAATVQAGAANLVLLDQHNTAS